MKAFYLPITLILLFSGDGFSQHSDSSMFYLKELPAKGVQLNKGWLFYPGDNVEYAEYHSDEKGGTPVNPTLVIDRLPFVQRSGIGWFRLKLWIDSSLQNKTIGMTISLFGAAEVYLNGEQVYKFGNVSADYESEKTQAVYGRALNLKLGENEQ